MSATPAHRALAAFLGLALFVPVAVLVLAFWNRDDRGSLLALAALAVVVRIPFLSADPLWSGDAFRYVWDGRLSARGIDPRAVAPDDPSLAADRASRLWPKITFRTIPTVYPPAALELFEIEAAIDRDGLRGAKVIALLADFAVALALLWALGRRSLPRGRVALYALHPLVLVSFAQDAHIEAYAIAGIFVALVAGSPLRIAALSLAILTKLYPAILLPLVFVRDRFGALVTIGIVGIAYLPTLLSGHIFGSMRNYLTEQGFNQAFALIGAPGSIVVFAIALFVSVRAVVRGVALLTASLFIIVMYLLCIPNVLPWYVAIVPALVAAIPAPFSGSAGPLVAGILTWSATVSFAFAVPWFAASGGHFDVALRILEYAPIVVGAIVSLRRCGPG